MPQKAAVNAKRLGIPLALSDGIESLRGLASDYVSKVEKIETEGHYPQLLFHLH